MKKRKPNLNKKLTIMLIPHSSHKPFAVEISLYKISLSILFICVFSAIFFSSGFIKSTPDKIVTNKNNNYEINQLKQEYIAKITKLNNYEKTIMNYITDKDQLSRNIGGPELSMPNASDLELNENYEETNINKLEDIKNFLEIKQQIFQYIPTIWPTKGWISSPFGYRKSPFTHNRAFHEGVDIGAWYGSPIYAAADGKVIFAGWKAGYGKVIILKHKFGFKTYYAHCSKLLLRRGNKVKRGDMIAKIGKTGRTTGSHLHYEVRINDIAVNPIKFMINE